MSQDPIEMNASNWKSRLDFYKDLLHQIGAPEWHGESVDALVDSMVYGGINSKQAPYLIRVSGISGLDTDVLEEVIAAKNAIENACVHRMQSTGHNVDIRFEIE